ncbi:pectate lyase superfamily protein-domain-containing protein, partial [Podospora didyma]
FHPSGASYTVYKNAITDCGAKGDGVTDDTKVIQDCIAAQNRCGGESLTCASTSVMPLVIYFPPGNYLVSSSIEMYFQTLLIGDPLDRPRIIAAKSFQGLGVLSSDFYIPGSGGKTWYINQSNFFRQLRNFIIDIRNCPDNPKNTPPPGPAALHWQVAQATSIQNVEIYMKESSRGHVGIFMENGSGGLLTGITFHGGYVGLRAGNQQFTIKNLTFDKCRTAIQAIWDWTFLWTNIKITGADIGIDLINQDLKNERKPQQTFAYLLIDSTISAKTGIRSNPFMATDGYAQITLDNVNFAGSETAIKETTGATVLAGAPKVDSWMWGIVASQESPTGRQVKGEAAKPVRNRPGGLLGGPNGGYFDKAKPQYENVPVGSFKNALSNGCRGDGAADDTACLQNLFGSPGYVFLPAGVYRVTDTVKIVSGVKLVGEAWSAITASGDKFKDMSKPRVMIQVGEKGQTGDVEISDILFQVEGPMAGAILVEWNIRASSPGSAGMWDAHFRIGGNAGSKLTAKECPRLSGTINTNCIAVNLMMHITTWGSGYFENMWGWTADHDLEMLDGTQIDIYTGRGILIESVNPTWLYGTGFEHAVMYQYMVHGANNLFMGLIQTETPYFQSLPPAPKPFDKAVGLFKGDPNFSKCNPAKPSSCMAWGLMIESSSNVLIYGAGIYSWFQKYAQDCLNTFDCQSEIVHLSNDKNIYIYNLATVGTVDMISSPGAKLMGSVHQSPRSNVSSINGWLGDADGSEADGNEPGATITLKSTIWLWPATQSDNKGTMTVACTPPCIFKFPPLTFPPLQPPPMTTTWDGKPYTVTPPVVKNATAAWNPVTYNNSGVVTTTPTLNVTTIPVPPWDCGAACGGHEATFPPISFPIPTPKDAPCWIYCDGAKPTQ